jgi:hypothetical protein
MAGNVSTVLTDLGTGLGNFFDSIGPSLGGFVAIIGIVLAIVGLMGGLTYMIMHGFKG